MFLSGESQGRGSLVGFRLWSRIESDMTEQLHFHYSLSCIGEGNGNPLQCSCLENPRDGTAWWAAVYGVAQSRTLLTQLSSSSSSPKGTYFILITANFQSQSLAIHNTLLFYSTEMLHLFLSLRMLSSNIIPVNVVFGTEVTYQTMK